MHHYAAVNTAYFPRSLRSMLGTRIPLKETWLFVTVVSNQSDQSCNLATDYITPCHWLSDWSKQSYPYHLSLCICKPYWWGWSQAEVLDLWGPESLWLIPERISSNFWMLSDDLDCWLNMLISEPSPKYKDLAGNEGTALYMCPSDS